MIRPVISPPRHAVAPVRINRASPWARGLLAWYPFGDAQSFGTATIRDCSGNDQHAPMESYDPGTGTGNTPWSATGQPWPENLQRPRPTIYWDDTNRAIIDSREEFRALQCPMTASGWWLPKSTTTGWLWSQYENSYYGKLGKGVEVTGSSIRWYGTLGSNDRYQSQTSTATYPNWTTGGRFNNWNFWAASVAGTLASPTLTLTLNDTTDVFSLSALSASIDTSVDVCLAGKTRGPTDFEEPTGWGSDFRFYTRAMSAAEHQALRRETFDGSYGTLAQQYRPIPRAAEGSVATAIPAAMNTYQQMAR